MYDVLNIKSTFQIHLYFDNNNNYMRTSQNKCDIDYIDYK